jgi:uncharacterized protein YegL
MAPASKRETRRMAAAYCPVILLLDCSQSMEGEPICQLNNALHRFCDERVEDRAAAL